MCIRDRLRAVGWADDTLLFQHVHNTPGTRITNLKAALQARCGAKLRFHHNMGGLPDKRVVILRLGNARANNAAATSHRHGSGRHSRQNLLVVVGLALRLNELDDLVDLVVRDKTALDTAGLAPVDF